MFVPCSLQKSEKKSHIFDILIYRTDSPHQSACLLIRVLSLEARRATQAERLTATTAMAAASVVAAAAAEQASSASPPFFALAPLVEMDYIASQPTPASADGPSPAFACSLAPLVYVEDFIEGGQWRGGGVLAGGDNVRVLVSAYCCRRRGEDATINIKWEVRGGRMTNGGSRWWL